MHQSKHICLVVGRYVCTNSSGFAVRAVCVPSDVSHPSNSTTGHPSCLSWVTVTSCSWSNKHLLILSHTCLVIWGDTLSSTQTENVPSWKQLHPPAHSIHCSPGCTWHCPALLHQASIFPLGASVRAASPTGNIVRLFCYIVQFTWR